VSTPGAYRIEVTLPGNSLPWILSNPIYLGMQRSTPSIGDSTPIVSQSMLALDAATGEASPGSTNEIAAATEISWQYRLAGGVAAGQYAAVRLPLTPGTDSRVRFSAKADRPLRVWVQLRRPGGEGERWGKTVYLDETERTFDLDLRSLAPLGATSSKSPDLPRVDSLLFVVDTVNTLPGSNGRVQIANVALVR
jgi:hypothetical protein